MSGGFINLLSGSGVCVDCLYSNDIAYNILKYIRLLVTPVPQPTWRLMVKLFKEQLGPKGEKLIIWSQPGVVHFCRYVPGIRPICPHCNIEFPSSNALIDHLIWMRDSRRALWSIDNLAKGMTSAFNENTSIDGHTGGCAQKQGSYSFIQSQLYSIQRFHNS